MNVICLPDTVQQTKFTIESSWGSHVDQLLCEVDDGKGNDGGKQTIKKRKKNDLIETMD